MRICPNRLVRPLVLFTPIVALAVACSRDTPAAGKDTATLDTPPLRNPATPPELLATVWDTAAGTFFAVAGDTPAQAFLIDPAYSASQSLDTLMVDSARVTRLQLDLLTRGDTAAHVRAAVLERDTSAACATWPLVRLAGIAGDSVTRQWDVAVPPGRARAIPFDSLPGMSSADSSRLTIAVARIVSRVAQDTAVAFRGRPYVVRQANRFPLDDGRQVVLAEVVRVVNQEANPAEEQYVLVLEAESPASNATLTPAHMERQAGLEEAIESVDLVAVLQLRNGTLALLIRREVGDGVRFVLLERAAPARWILRWRSAFAGC